MRLLPEPLVIEHALLWHGNCLEHMKRIPDKSIDAIFTDLPYATTACKWDSIIPLEELWREYKRIRKLGAPAVLNAAPPFTYVLAMSNLKELRHSWVWDKKQSGNPFTAKKMPLRVTEDVLVFAKGKLYYNPQMRRGKMRKKGGGTPPRADYAWGENKVLTESYNDLYYPTNIIPIVNPRKNKLHPTEKPVELYEYLMETYTRPGDLILDTCFGSGASGEAALRLGRRYLGIEQDDHYYSIGSERVYKALGAAEEQKAA